jgi:hypothetical protein
MTSVVVTTAAASVVVTEGGSSTVVTAPRVTQSVAVITEGPQGPQGPQGPAVSAEDLYFAQLQDVNVADRVDQAVVYYSSASAKFKADGTNTILSLTDGGNF